MFFLHMLIFGTPFKIEQGSGIIFTFNKNKNKNKNDYYVDFCTIM